MTFDNFTHLIPTKYTYQGLNCDLDLNCQCSNNTQGDNHISPKENKKVVTGRASLLTPCKIMVC